MNPRKADFSYLGQPYYFMMRELWRYETGVGALRRCDELKNLIKTMHRLGFDMRIQV